MNEFDGEHYWEIGKAEYPLNKNNGDIQKSGFKMERTYGVFEHLYHRFFILAKINYE